MPNEVPVKPRCPPATVPLSSNEVGRIRSGGRSRSGKLKLRPNLFAVLVVFAAKANDKTGSTKYEFERTASGRMAATVGEQMMPTNETGRFLPQKVRLMARLLVCGPSVWGEGLVVVGVRPWGHFLSPAAHAQLGRRMN